LYSFERQGLETHLKGLKDHKKFILRCIYTMVREGFWVKIKKLLEANFCKKILTQLSLDF